MYITRYRSVNLFHHHSKQKQRKGKVEDGGRERTVRTHDWQLVAIE